MKLTLVLETLDQKLFINELRKRLVSKSFFGLRGPMGAGKTTLIAQLLGDDNVLVSSPTFALFNSYLIDGLDFVHVDLYRLENEADIESAGFWDLFSNEKSVIFTEWIDRIELSNVPLGWTHWLIEINIKVSDLRAYSLSKIG